MTTSWSHSTPPTNWTWVEDQLEDVETAAGRCAPARSHGSYDLCSVISRRSLPAPVCLIDKIRRSLINLSKSRRPRLIRSPRIASRADGSARG